MLVNVNISTLVWYAVYNNIYYGERGGAIASALERLRDLEVGGEICIERNSRIAETILNSIFRFLVVIN